MTAADVVPHWLNVSRETLEKLHGLCALVRKWNPAVNLVAKSTIADLWQRHLLDSAQLFRFCPSDARSWIDLGSGAGFPGLVMAAMAGDQMPDLRVTLVESDRRKAVFLGEAIRTLGLTAEVICQRIEDVTPFEADVVSARALSSLVALCGHAHKHLRSTGTAIFPKGANFAAEITDAQAKWRFEVDCHRSHTDTNASILVLKEVRHA